jgi:hypothetical protein
LHRPACPPRRRHRRAVLGVVHDQTESNTNERPEQRPDNDQELTATAKRTVHKASKLETDLQYVAIPDTLKPEQVGAPWAAGASASNWMRLANGRLGAQPRSTHIGYQPRGPQSDHLSWRRSASCRRNAGYAPSLLDDKGPLAPSGDGTAGMPPQPLGGGRGRAGREAWTNHGCRHRKGRPAEQAPAARGRPLGEHCREVEVWWSRSVTCSTSLPCAGWPIRLSIGRVWTWP